LTLMEFRDIEAKAHKVPYIATSDADTTYTAHTVNWLRLTARNAANRSKPVL